MDALRNLLDNEKGLVAMLLIIGATALVAIGSMSIADWKDFSKWIFTVYASATALHESARAFSQKPTSIATEPATSEAKS